RARGFACEGDCVLVLLGGGAPRSDQIEEVRTIIPLLTAVFGAERKAAAREAHAVIARSWAERAEAVTTSLAASQSELHRVLHQVQTNERWLTVTLQGISDALIATDGDGRIVLM